MPDACDVLVVGAGPAGATAAALFARNGLRVILVDRMHFPRSKACAEYMSPGVGDVLRRLDVADRVLASAKRVPGMEIVSRRGKTFRIQYSDGDRRVYATTMRREKFDTILVDWAAACGAVIEEGFVAHSAILDDANVVGVAGAAHGRRRCITAALTVIADGSRSTLAGSLGLAAVPRWPVRLGLVAHYEGVSRLTDGFGQMHVSSGGYCGIAPLPDGAVNVSLVVRADALKCKNYSATRFFDDWLDVHPRVRDVLAGCRRISPVRGVGVIGSRAHRAWAPGALLAGDAAGFFDPFTGEGMHRALLSAEMVCKVGLRALELGDTSGTTLASYSALRTDAFRWKQGVTALVQTFVQWPSLLEYGIPRLDSREIPRACLSSVLGDLADARQFLAPPMLWSALRP